MDVMGLLLIFSLLAAIAVPIALIVVAVQVVRMADRVCEYIDAMMRCPSCATTLRNPRAEFCGKCGAQIARAA
jgi:rRNA maturation endonuclease Nob1